MSDEDIVCSMSRSLKTERTMRKVYRSSNGPRRMCSITSSGSSDDKSAVLVKSATFHDIRFAKPLPFDPNDQTTCA
jgi:hypothetical protein